MRLYFLLGKLFIFSLFCSLLVSCATPPTTWDLQYKEKVRVTTEPAGARIYVQDNYRGVSPIQVTLDGGDLNVKQYGSRLPLIGSIRPGYWTIKAHLDGYEPASATIRCGETSAYRRAIKELRPGDKMTLPSVVVGNNAVLLSLRPQPGVSGRPAPQQQQQQQQQTVVIPGAGSSATSARGMVMVSSTPENAEIYADGAFVGNGPANLKLSEGIHIIEVKKAGFTTYRKELRVIGSSQLNLRVTLEKK